MLLWMITAGAGLYLLVSGRPGRPAGSPVADEVAVTEAAEAEAVTPVTVPASRPAQAGIPQAAAEALAAGARVPPITHTRIATQPGQHPLLEFMHPALGIVGLGIWIAYVATKFGTFAWVSFGILLATIAAGLTWYTVNRRQIAARSSEVLETAGAPGTAGVLVTRDVVVPEAGTLGAGASEAGAAGTGRSGRGPSGTSGDVDGDVRARDVRGVRDVRGRDGGRDAGDARDGGATLPAAPDPDPRVSRRHHPRAGDHHPPGLRPHLTPQARTSHSRISVCKNCRYGSTFCTRYWRGSRLANSGLGETVGGAYDLCYWSVTEVRDDAGL